MKPLTILQQLQAIKVEDKPITYSIYEVESVDSIIKIAIPSDMVAEFDAELELSTLEPIEILISKFNGFIVTK